MYLMKLKSIKIRDVMSAFNFLPDTSNDDHMANSTIEKN